MPPASPPNQPPAAPQAAPPAAPAGTNAATQQSAANIATIQTNVQDAVTAFLAAKTAAAEPNAQQQAIENMETTRTHAQNAITALQAAVTPAAGQDVSSTSEQPPTNIVTPKTFRKKMVEAAGATTKLAVPTGLVAAGASAAHWPILGKIPYLPETAQMIQESVLSASSYLGMNTGTAATISWLAGLPNFVGPTAVAAGGLWGLGKFNEWLTGRVEKSGLNMLRTMWNGVRLPYDLPVKTLQKIGEGISWTYKYSFGDKEHQKPGAIGRSWDWTKKFTRKYWRTGAGMAIGAGLLAPATGGSSLVWGIVGGLLARYWDKKGYLGSSAKTAASPTTHP